MTQYQVSTSGPLVMKLIGLEVSAVSLSFCHWYPGSGVVHDSIDS